MGEIGSNETEARWMKKGSIEIAFKILSKMLLSCRAQTYGNVLGYIPLYARIYWKKEMVLPPIERKGW